MILAHLIFHFGWKNGDIATLVVFQVEIQLKRSLWRWLDGFRCGTHACMGADERCLHVDHQEAHPTSLNLPVPWLGIAPPMVILVIVCHWVAHMIIIAGIFHFLFFELVINWGGSQQQAHPNKQPRRWLFWARRNYMKLPHVMDLFNLCLIPGEKKKVIEIRNRFFIEEYHQFNMFNHFRFLEYWIFSEP